VSAEEIEGKLAKMMDEIPEIEGLIAFDAEGKLITGQTITELDNDKICNKSLDVFNKALELGKITEKNNIKEIIFYAEEGNIIIAGSKNLNIIALIGKDAAHSIALVMRALRTLVES